ncbi:sensor domain-containing diguanylate cyclase [Deinococcus sp. YIM 77859]|uniref:sensor domain-containing diguanylate cyclase n=1 Tax=Deinococcus sp. YIM 77859 TaxID=1540221 RepID=UPI00054ECB7A|nr:sensor domain-containing diguanylate cyclase [Deinococcus sp. YIM 77859]
MSAAPLPDHEYARLLELARYDVLDTPPEAAFDRLTRLTARVLRVPVAAIHFVDQDRQWGKSCFGTGDTAVRREVSFCAWTILEDGVLLVPDTTRDPRFQDNPLVTGPARLRMYAGAPLVTPRGYRLGTLCVADTVPRVLSAGELATLQDLAALVVDELELRLRQRELEAQVDRQRRELAELEQLVAHARVLEAVSELLDLPLTPQEAARAAAALVGEAVQADWTGLLALQGEALTIQVAHHRPDLPPALRNLAECLPELPGGITRSLRDTRTATYLDDYPRAPGALPEAVAAGVKAAAWVPLGRDEQTTFLLVAVRAAPGEHATWQRSDRALLDAAGRSVRAALERRTVLEARDRAVRQDSLTGIGNRLAFEEALAARRQAGTPFRLAVIDLDGFKGVNDHEGHPQGDQVLRVFAAALQGAVGAGSEVYRYGGDEFILLAADLTEEEVLEQVDIAVLAARQVTTQPVGASVGMVDDRSAEDGAALLGLADERMYATKRRRRDARRALLAHG